MRKLSVFFITSSYQVFGFRWEVGIQILKFCFMKKVLFFIAILVIIANSGCYVGYYPHYGGYYPYHYRFYGGYGYYGHPYPRYNYYGRGGYSDHYRGNHQSYNNGGNHSNGNMPRGGGPSGNPGHR